MEHRSVLNLANRLRAQADYLFREDQRRISAQTYSDMLRAATVIRKLNDVRLAEEALDRTMKAQADYEDWQVADSEGPGNFLDTVMEATQP